MGMHIKFCVFWLARAVVISTLLLFKFYNKYVFSSPEPKAHR